MTKEEKSEILKFVKEKTAGRVPIVLGIGGNNTSAVVEEILNTDLSGIDSILSICPYYTKPSQRGIYAHFEAVAKASPLPVILYNVPGRTSKNIDPDTVIKLANDFKNIVAIKEASGNMNQIMSILAKKPKDFCVISGDDSLAVPMISLGCVGVISVAANVVPAQFSKMIKSALEGDFAAAREIHFSLLELMNALFEDGSPSGAKAALNILGIMEENLRLPLVPVSPSVREKIKTLLSKLS
jgi:4-hydroxy-tetrahydrodipicolinate synthase